MKRGVVGFVAVVCLVVASDASAQYKNDAWGISGGINVLFPGNNLQFYVEQAAVDPVDPQKFPATVSQLPSGSRFPNGAPFSTLNAVVDFEYVHKLSLDHWWWKTGLNFGLISIVHDPANNAPGGMSVWMEGMFGPKIYFLTDDFRPFGEFGLRVGGLLNVPNAFIPTKLRVLVGPYATLGLEFIVVRDIALSIAARYTRIITLNFPGYNLVEGLGGMVLYF